MRKRSESGPPSEAKNNSFTSLLRNIRKSASFKGQILKFGETKGIKTFLDSLTISKPYDFVHDVKVTFNPADLTFNGMPASWNSQFTTHFNCSLTTCPRIVVPGYSDRIPAVLVMLQKQLIESGGLEVEGIFRKAPLHEECIAIKDRIKTNSAAVLTSEEHKISPHVYANLIKQFFRDLKPCLFDCLSHEQILNQDIESLPEPNISVLLWLLDLMKQVVSHSERNRMTTKNLAIVFSPNLFSADFMNPMEALVLSQKAVTLVTSLLEERVKNN